MEEILPPQLQRQVVFYRTTEAPGTIIVHTSERHLHLYVVQGNGVRCATASPQWQGLLKIARKQEWPDWKPPPKMIERQPYLPRFMAGGPGIPPGARALSRHDGLPYPRHIGSAVSSGCFPLVNADVIDLYDRIPVGAKVIIRQKPSL
jgi:lipoprotein-anchoring transpeptidase ErfK/SrfK